MKKQTILSIAYITFMSILLSSCSDESTSAETDSFNAAVVCPENLRGTFVDERDGLVYKYTTIGNQVWMAENLNYDNGSFCVETTCSTKGRFYRLAEALNACPNGWHLPSNEEWQVLFSNVGGIDSAGLRLKATTGWIPLNPGWASNGTDDCGFTLLPMPKDGHDGYIAWLWATDVKLLEALLNGRELREDDTMTGVSFETQNMGARTSRHFIASIRCIKD